MLSIAYWSKFESRQNLYVCINDYLLDDAVEKASIFIGLKADFTISKYLDEAIWQNRGMRILFDEFYR